MAADAGAIGHGQYFFGGLARHVRGEVPQKGLDARDERGRHGEFIDPHAVENEEIHRVGGHFAAQAQAFALGPGRFCHKVKNLQDGGVQRIVVFVDQGVVAVGGQHVLDQVVGPQGEEVDLLGQLRRQHDGGRDFDHDADRHRLGEGDVFPDQIRPGFLDYLLAGTNFFESGDHRKQQLDRAVCAGHHDRLDLGAENIPVVEGNPDRTPAHEGVVFLGRAEIGEGLVAADVEGADGHRVVGEILDYLAVELILVVAVGKAAPGHVGEFGAVQADSFGPVAQGDVDVADQTDIGAQGDLLPVAGNGRQVAEFVKPVQFPAGIGFEPAVFFGDVRGGIDVEASRVGIENDPAFRGGRLDRALDPDQGRDAERFGHDHRMGIAFAGFGHDPLDLFVVERRHVRGEDFPGDQNAGTFELQSRLVVVVEVGQQAPADILDVGGSLPQVRVIHALEYFDVLGDDFF